MYLPDEFLKRAAECERMAQTACDSEGKSFWNGMATRWHRCVEVEKIASASASVPREYKHRSAQPGWARHSL
jgi:hypothetical protein